MLGQVGVASRWKAGEEELVKGWRGLEDGHVKSEKTPRGNTVQKRMQEEETTGPRGKETKRVVLQVPCDA